MVVDDQMPATSDTAPVVLEVDEMWTFVGKRTAMRQRCGVLVRKSCSFSKSLAMHHVRIHLCIHAHNQRITTS